jgi:O-antigen/teichoic acid export membrane protein
VWTLLMSLTGYLGLVDVGVRVSTGRFLNYFLGRGEQEKVDRLISTSLAFFTAVSLAVMAVAAGLGLAFGRIFTKFPPELAAEASWILPLMGLNVWLGFYAATFSQLLASRERFDLMNVVELAVLGLRAGGTVWVLWAGHGITALALVLMASNVTACVLLGLLAWRKGSPAAVRKSNVSLGMLKEIFGFSVWAFVGNVSVQIVFYASSAVIGLLIGAAEITYYSIAAMLVGYASALVSHVSNIMSPDIFKAAGQEDLAQLRWLSGKAMRTTMLIMVPILVGYMALGREFIGLWMGPRYGESAWILLLLAIPAFCDVANRPLGAAFMGLGHVRLLAVMAATHAVSNLCLAVCLVLAGLGIRGVALGAVVPGVAVPVWFFVVATSRMRGGVWTFFRATVLRWMVAGALFAGLCMGIRALLPEGGWLWFWIKVGILAALYAPIGLLVTLNRDEGVARLRRLAQMAYGKITPAERMAP